MLAFNGRLGKFLPKKASSKKWNIILPQVHELFPETPFLIHQSTGWRIVYDGGLHSFHLQRFQSLEPGNYNKRFEFPRGYLQESTADRNFEAFVLFTDETALSLEGVMKVHNRHHWEVENPHATCTYVSKRKFTFNMWAGIVQDILLGPYVLPDKIVSPKYLTFFQEALPEMTNDIPLYVRRHIRI